MEQRLLPIRRTVFAAGSRLIQKQNLLEKTTRRGKTGNSEETRARRRDEGEEEAVSELRNKLQLNGDPVRAYQFPNVTLNSPQSETFSNRDVLTQYLHHPTTPRERRGIFVSTCKGHESRGRSNESLYQRNHFTKQNGRKVSTMLRINQTLNLPFSRLFRLVFSLSFPRGGFLLSKILLFLKRNELLIQNDIFVIGKCSYADVKDALETFNCLGV